MEKDFLLKRDQLSIPVKISEPDYGEIRRVVLSVHGIGGSSVDDIQMIIAEEMELFSSAVYRFDFPCHGESPMNNLTLENCVGSLTAVAEFAKDEHPEVEDLCVFATGFGAYVTLVSLPQLLDLPGEVKLVVQTPSLRMDATLLGMLSLTQESLRVMDRVVFPATRPFEVTYSFYNELRQNPALIPYSIPILILHGERDSFIPMADIQNFRRLNEESKLVIIPGTSHRFLEEGAWDMVLDLTRDWFQFEQVLLTDWQ